MVLPPSPCTPAWRPACADTHGSSPQALTWGRVRGLEPGLGLCVLPCRAASPLWTQSDCVPCPCGLFETVRFQGAGPSPWQPLGTACLSRQLELNLACWSQRTLDLGSGAERVSVLPGWVWHLWGGIHPSSRHGQFHGRGSSSHCVCPSPVSSQVKVLVPSPDMSARPWSW